EVLVAQVHRPVAIDYDLDMGAVARGADQRLLQFQPHLVLKHDEGFQQHFLPCLTNAFEHPREELLPIDQQIDRIAFTPYVFHWKRTSTARGDRKSTRLNSSHVKISYAV